MGERSQFPGCCCTPSVIERFAAHAPGLTAVTRRTLRTNLRFINRRVVPALHPADAALSRQRAKTPYTTAEVSGFLALAAAQPTPGRRARAGALICLARVSMPAQYFRVLQPRRCRSGD